jgi:hypothetical protein
MRARAGARAAWWGDAAVGHDMEEGGQGCRGGAEQGEETARGDLELPHVGFLSFCEVPLPGLAALDHPSPLRGEGRRVGGAWEAGGVGVTARLERSR